MTIRPIIVAAIGSALLMGIMLPMANAQAPPCFTFDGQIKTMECPASFRPTPVQYYANPQFVQASDDSDDELPRGFFDQRTIETLRQNAAQAQNQTVTNNNATAAQAQVQRQPIKHNHQ